MSCLRDEELLGIATSATAQAHVASCERCAARLEQLRSKQQLEAPTSEIGAPAAPPKQALLADGTKVGRYVVVGVAGEGGMGTVYKAFDPELDRKIALKLLRVSSNESQPGEARARMLREAQALARLSHPNVISIYDVGTHGENVYLALELVEGITLREWLLQSTHDWREIVRVFLAAAEGLAAAHDASLIHRDFKPLNVLIAKDGRVRVLDFGLARAAHASAAPKPGTLALSAPLSEISSSSSLSNPLTREGAVSGTAGYIAPEVLRGQPADGRGDQFAFGVALFEALFGKRPWSAASLTESLAALLTGTPPVIPSDTRVPSWVQAVVLRTLAVDPGDRYPGMRELIRALSKDPAAARSRALTFVGAALLLGLSGVGLGVWLRARPDCASEGKRLDGAWDANVRARIEASFLATGRPAASDTFSRVSHALDEWSKSWASEAAAACTAEAKVDGALREAELLRRVCLERRLGELKALTDLFQSADPGVVDQATNAAKVLIGPQRCREPRLMTGAVLPISDPKARSAADALHGRLDRANAQFVSGQFPLAMKTAEEIAKAAHEQKLQVVEAEALNLLGKIQGRSYLLTEAAQTAAHAMSVAQEAGADIEIFAAAVRLAHVSNMARKHDEATRAVTAAEAVHARLGDDELIEADLLEARAGALIAELKLDEGTKLRQRALELKTRRLGADHPESIACLLNTAQALSLMGDYRQASVLTAKALTISEQSLGKDHPAMIVARCNLCYTYYAEGRFAEGAELCAAGAALATRIHGELNPMSGWCLGNLASLYASAGDGPKALEAGERAVAIVDKLFKPDDLEYAEARLYRARALMVVGKLELARADIDAALGPAEKAMDREDPFFSEYVNAKGQIELAAGDAKKALPFLESAVELRERRSAPTDRADSKFGLARALWDAGGDRARAHALAAQAFASLADFPGYAPLRGRVEKWLTEHPAPK